MQRCNIAIGSIMNPQKKTMKNQVAALHRAIQLMVALSGCMNKALALPNVNLNVYKIRITQATKFFETHAPNNKIGKQRHATAPHFY